MDFEGRRIERKKKEREGLIERERERERERNDRDREKIWLVVVGVVMVGEPPSPKAHSQTHEAHGDLYFNPRP